MSKLTSLAAVIALSALTVPAFGQSASPDPTATPGIDRRLDNQEKRIQQGIDSGRLTGREAARMERRQDKIEADLDQAKADGTVSARERQQLHREQDRSSQAIARQKHDRQHDYNHNGKVDRPRRN
ncbi:MAG: hypothetical protein IT530_16365 [Burkholderiales bacterium]|nr:hypothetical protein [Burkholderiales bacterium]